jgi:hypothetical protein
MSLDSLIDDPSASIGSIAELLDGLPADERWRACSKLDRTRQRLLYEKAAGSPPLVLADLVGSVGPVEEVVHDGRNTLPVPAPLRRFEKRFCRPTEGDRLFGYNEGPTRKLLGPGYFVAMSTADRPESPDWAARGGVFVDYLQVPDGPVPAGWPQVRSNSKGLQRFVYDGTRDFLRRVSSSVVIGAAFKGDEPLDHYFVLCRR